MELRLLGMMELFADDGNSIDAGPLKRRVVLAMLGLQPGRVVSNERLIDAVWGDEPPRSALATLRGLISDLRGTMGTELVVTTASGYRLMLDRSEVDVTRFEDVAQNDTGMADALAMWTGVALEGLGESLAIAAERRRLESLRGDVVERWAAAALAAGRPDTVIGELEREVARSRWREPLWELLMLALYRAGRQADALDAFRRARHHLAEELGLAPGPALRDLEHRILEHDPSIMAPEPIGSGRISHRSNPRTLAAAPTFAGRVGELTHLRHLLPSESGFVAMVVGEPGIGKTRLLDELVTEAATDGMCVIWGRCPDGEWAAPYSPLVEGLERHLALMDAHDARRLIEPFAEPLADVLPIVRELLPTLAAMRTTNIDDLRFEIFEAFSGLLNDIAQQRPTVLVLDDLHWADHATLTLLPYVIPLTSRLPVSIFGTYRDTDLNDTHPLLAGLATLQRDVRIERVRLRGLSHSAARDLITAMTETTPAEERVEALLASSGGNPFYLTELIRFGQDVGHDHDTDHAASGLPDSVIDTLQLRMGRLSGPTRTMLRVGALFDEQFPLEATRLVADLDEATALDALDEAIAAHLIEPTDSMDEYRFVHALARVAVQSTINASRLPRMHRRIATTIEARIAELPMRTSTNATMTTNARIAAHYYASRALAGAERGVDAALAAAEHADQVAAHAERARFLRFAETLMPAHDLRRPQAVAQLCLALARSQQPVAAAAEALVASRLLADAEGDDAACAFIGDIITEIRLAFNNPTQERLMQLYELGIAYGDASRSADWRRLKLRAHYARIQALDDSLFRERAELYSDVEYTALNREAAAIDFDHRLRADTIGCISAREEAVALARQWHGELTELVGGWPAVIDHGVRAIEMYQRRRQSAPLVLTCCGVASALAMSGEMDEAWRRLAAADAARAASVPDVRHWNNLIVATFVLYALADGPWDDYIARAKQMWQVSIETRAWQSGKEEAEVASPAGPTSDAMVAVVNARRGRSVHALTKLESLVAYLWEASPQEYRHAFIHHSAAEVVWLTGDTTLLATVEGAIRARWLPNGFTNFGTSVELSLARLCAVDGRVEEATTWFAAARSMFVEQGARPLAAIADHDEAWMHIRHPGHAPAADVAALLDRCIEASSAIGLPGWEKRARRLRLELDS